MATPDRPSRSAARLVVTASTLLVLLAGAACVPAIPGPGPRAVARVVAVMSVVVTDVAERDRPRPLLDTRLAITRGMTLPVVCDLDLRLLDLPPPAFVTA